MSTSGTPNNIDQPGILTARDLVNWKIQQGILKVPTPPSKVIISPQLKMIRSKKRRFSQQEIKGLVGMHLCMDAKNGIYLCGGWGLGGPAMVAICEELHELGATEFYLLGVAGRLTDEIQEGELVVAASAIREDGASAHYLPLGVGDEVSCFDKTKLLQLSDSLAAKAVKFVSTDAPYRETIEKYKQWHKAEAKIIDMETASLYAFSHFHKIHAASIGIGADSIANGKWTMANDYPQIEKKLSDNIDKLIGILQ